jgi:hypothetical protein
MDLGILYFQDVDETGSVSPVLVGFGIDVVLNHLSGVNTAQVGE